MRHPHMCGLYCLAPAPPARVLLQHPDTVGGAMLSGVREARRLLAQLRNGDEGAAAAYGSAQPSKVLRV